MVVLRVDNFNRNECFCTPPKTGKSRIFLTLTASWGILLPKNPEIAISYLWGKAMECVRKTVWQMVGEIIERYPERAALIHRERGMRCSYRRLGLDMEQAARGMIALGLEKGDRIALWAPNIPEWIIAFLGIAAIGGIVVPVDPGAREDDLRFLLEQSECRAIIMAAGAEGREYVEMLRKVRDKLPLLQQTIAISEEIFPEMIPWTELAGRGASVARERLQSAAAAVHPEEPVAIMYTSGTTGRPKGVVLNHLGLLNKSLFSNERQGLTHTDRLCLFFPLFHMFGSTCIALSGLIQGAALIMPAAAFAPPKILRAIREEGCTAIYGSPSMIIALLENPEFRKDDWALVKRGVLGGAPCPVELMRKLVEDVGVSGIAVAYGTTEASSWLTMTLSGDPVELRVGTIGTSLACNEVKIVDPQTGEDLPVGSAGEICTRGFLMQGYYRMPGATANAIDHDGWYHTGDLGRMDERGYVYITGRLKDVIRRDGLEIYPSELEEVLYRHPEIAEAQVFGFPHPEKGQEAAAWVRLKEGALLTEQEVAAYLKATVAPEKMPGNVKIVERFPMTRSGKVQKFKLAELI